MPLLFTASALCEPARSCRSVCPSQNGTSRTWPMWATLPGSTAGYSRLWTSSHLEARARVIPKFQREPLKYKDLSAEASG